MTACWMNLGQNLKVNAKKFPNTVCLKDSRRSFTYPQTNARVNRLAHSLTSLGLSKGDKLAVLLENSIEIVELYLATAKTGIVIVPINFRLMRSRWPTSSRMPMPRPSSYTTNSPRYVDTIKDRSETHSAGELHRRGPAESGYRRMKNLSWSAPDSEPEAEVGPKTPGF